MPRTLVSRFLCVSTAILGALALTPATASAQAGPTNVQGGQMGGDQPGVSFDGTGTSCSDPFQLTLFSNPGDGDGSTPTKQLDIVKTSTGYPDLAEVDIALPAEVMIPIGRSYNISVSSTGNQNKHYQGVCWFQNSQPEILVTEDALNHANDVVTLVFAADKYVAYQRTSSTSDEYLGLNGAAGIFQFVAAASGEPDLWVLTDPKGWKATFVGFAGSPGDQAGQLWKIESPSGARAFVGADGSIAGARTAGGWGTNGRIAKAFDSLDRRFTYSFTAVDSISRLASVTVETRSGVSWSSPGTVTEVAKVEYDYYVGNSDANGLSGDLRMVTRTTPMSDSGVALTQRKYYRYHIDNSAGPDHGVMLVLDFEGARKFDWQDSSFDNDFLSASTNDLKPYAAAYLEYDSSNRVNSAEFSGQCGCSGGGANGAYTLAYSDNLSFSGTSGYDTGWHHRTVIARPDGSYVTQYFDEKGQALSTVISTSNPASSSPTPTHYATKVVRNSTGHVAEVWTPDSIATYTHNDGSGDPSGTFSADTSGLVHLYSRVSSGAAKGYLADEKWRDIASASEYFLRSLTWDTTSVDTTIGSQTLARPVIASVRVYTQAVTSGTTGSVLSSYSYTTHTGIDLAILKITETKPTVSTGNNGSGSTHYVYSQLRPDGKLEYRAENDLESGGRKIVERRTYKTTGQLDTVYEDADTSGISGLDSTFSSDAGALNEAQARSYDAQGRLVTLTTHDGRTMFEYYSVLADRRVASLSFPDYTTSGGTKYWGPASYSVTNHAGQTEFSATVAMNSNYTTDATTYFVTETDADPITSIGDGVTLGDLRSVSTSVFDNTGTRVTEQRSYFLTPSSGAGTDGTNYDPTSFAHDGMGRRIRIKQAHGTITRMVYDKRGHIETVKMGTIDTGMAGSDTTGTSNMVDTESTTFDANGNVSSRKAHTAGSTGRTTTYTTDVRGRAVLLTRPTAPHTFNKFDNLGRVIASGEFSSTASIVVGTDDPTTEPANRLALRETAFDERGRTYLRTYHKIDQADGSDDDNLTSSTWYDEMGRVLKVDGEQLAKYRYDRLGRQTHEFTLASDDDGSTFTNVDDVAGDTVLEERQTTFDTGGHVTMTATIARLHDDVGGGATTGALDTNADSNSNKYTQGDIEGRIQITAYWYDYLGREVARAEYGSNGSGNATTFDRSPLTAVPTRSDTVLVTTTDYGKDGTVEFVVDPKAQKTAYLRDHLGRTTAEISNHVNGTPSGETGADDNFVRYDFTDGLMTALWVDFDGDGTKDPSGPKDQVTRYIYGTKVGTPSVSQIATGHLIRAEIYPESGNAGAESDDIDSDSSDVVSYAYNAQGEIVQKQDQSGNLIDTDFDGSGRIVARKVTTLASGFDGAVRRINHAFDDLGRKESVSQYSDLAATAMTDSVEYSYDDWGNLKTFSQDALGNGGWRDIEYVHTKATTGRNTLRRTAAILPNGQEYRYLYASSSSLDDAASRVTNVADDNDTPLATYSYLGVGQLVKTYLEEPEVYSSLYGASGTTFSGLDEFNRPIKSRWAKDLSTDVDFFSVNLGWDRASNVQYQDDQIYGGHDVLYVNDGRNRLTDADEGTVSLGTPNTIGTRTRRQEWSLTQTGNWTANKVDLDGNGSWSGTGELNETRVHNEVNELQTRDTDSNSSVNFTFSYDAVGNMKSDGEAFDYVWDAFGRLRAVYELGDSGDSTHLVSEYWYNGLGHLTVRHQDTTSDGLAQSGDRKYVTIYDERWRQVATYRVNPSTGALDANPKEQFLYHAAGDGGWGGSSYIDSVILRDKDTNLWTNVGKPSSGTSELAERRYYCQNWRADVVVLLDEGGGVVQGARYSAYGVPFGIPYGDVNADGTCDAADDLLVAGMIAPSYSYDVRGDINLDGDVDGRDRGEVQGNSGDTKGYGVLSDRTVRNRKGYAGYEGDSSLSAVWHVRYRVLDSRLGRWLRRDPAGYVDELSLPQYILSSPLNYRDPLGLATDRGHCSPFYVYGSTVDHGWAIRVDVARAKSGFCACGQAPCRFHLNVGVGWKDAAGNIDSLRNPHSSLTDGGNRTQIWDDWHTPSEGNDADISWESDTGDVDDFSEGGLGDHVGDSEESFGVWGGNDSTSRISSQPQAQLRVECGTTRFVHIRLSSPAEKSIHPAANGEVKNPEGMKNLVMDAFIVLWCGGCGGNQEVNWTNPLLLGKKKK